MSETVRLRPWPRCKTCGGLIQVSTSRCVECDLPKRCFGCAAADAGQQSHPGNRTPAMECECECHGAPEIAVKESGR